MTSTKTMVGTRRSPVNMNHVMSEAVSVLESASAPKDLGLKNRPGPFRHVLIVLDGSTSAEEVVGVIEPVAAVCGSRVTLMRVISPFESTFLQASVNGIPHDGMALTRTLSALTNAERYLRLIATKLQSAGIETLCEVRGGKRPGEVILSRARELDVDLIALTAVGRGGGSGAPVGSIAQQVLANAPCSVLMSGTEHRR